MKELGTVLWNAQAVRPPKFLYDRAVVMDVVNTGAFNNLRHVIMRAIQPCNPYDDEE